MDSAIHCRKGASLFDVSHMLGITLKGKDAVPFVEKLVVGDIAELADGTGTLTLITTERGTVLDDSVLAKVSGQEVYMVLNAGCRDKDTAHIKKHLEAFQSSGGDVQMESHADRCLLALQGPKAASVLQQHVQDDLSKMYFSNFKKLDIMGEPCFLTRTGYTGEDGFEISCPSGSVLKLAQGLVAHEGVKLAGLGARDSLRLEAGLCLYGQDVTEDITPVEASLKWTIGKRRREKFDFLGGDVIKATWDKPLEKRRVGILAAGPPAREHTPVKNENGELVGELSSGAYSPNLKTNVAMGYIKKGFDKVGTKLKTVVRGKENPAEVAKMPFVPTKYYKAEQ